MSFGKSLLIAVGATGTSLTAVAVAGLLTNSGPLSLGPDAQPETEEPAPLEMRTVVTDPVPLDRRGYSLTGSKQDDLVFVSVEMIVRHQRDRQRVCKLMPRLKASILSDLGPRLRPAPATVAPDGEAVNAFVHDRFDSALGGNVVTRATVRVSDHRRGVPKSNCAEALHGGWQAWIGKAQRDLRDTER